MIEKKRRMKREKRKVEKEHVIREKKKRARAMGTENEVKNKKRK